MIDTEELILTVNDLLLDVENPRLGSVASQSMALENLIKMNSTHFRNLMLSIKKDGLDPGDSFYVIKAEEDGDYIVLDGNRRLSALKVLFGPDVLDGTDLPTATKKSLLSAASGFDVDEFRDIRCVCFKDREEAKEWILKRHTGSRVGEGRINWISSEIQRFTDDRSVLDVIDFVGRNADFADNEWESIKSRIENRKWSTIARLLESAVVREHIGISIEEDSEGHKTPLLSRDPKWVAAVLKKFIEDVLGGAVNSRNLNTIADIKEYLRLQPRKLRVKGKKVAKRAFRDINIRKPKSSPKKTTKPRSKKTSALRLRQNLAQKNRSFKSPRSPKGERLLVEATRINVKNFTISSAFILRAFIELAVDEYMKKKKLSNTRKGPGGRNYDLGLLEKAKLVRKHIIDDGSISEANMRPFRNNILTATAPASIQSLNGFMHGRYHIPNSEALIVGWDSCVPVFEAAFGEIS